MPSVDKLEKKLVVVAGPTAVGKTAVAIALARALDSQVVSADSRQLYREPDIGTAKPDERQLKAVVHHFVNSHSVHESYDAARYGEDALKTIHEIFLRHDYAILCGGSGLYIKAVCEGFDEIPAVPESVRQSLVQEWRVHGIGWLQQKMLELDPGHFKSVDPLNPHRLIRALEVRLSTGLSISHFRGTRKREHDFRIVKIGLELPREELYQRVDQRMDEMIARGLFEEAVELYPLRHLNALQTVGYTEIYGYLDHRYDRDEAVRLLKRNSRRYAKRQLTWFKRDQEMRWFHPGQLNEMIGFVEQSD